MVRLNAVICGLLSCQVASLLERDLSTDGGLRAVLSSEVSMTLEVLSDALLDPVLSDKTNVEDALKAASSEMDTKTAAQLVEKKELTPDVANLVSKVNTGSFGGFSEESLAKARRALNDLVEKAWIELDDKIFKCKGFQEMNRENYAQVTRDIMRLIEQINDLERIEAEAIEGIAEKESEIKDAEELLAKETQLYNIEYA